MPVNDLSVFGLIKQKLKWHQARQRVLAENVANADMPDFKPRELAPVSESQLRPAAPSIQLYTTNAAHVAGQSMSGGGTFGRNDETGWETTPDGNAVVLEEQMMKVTENQMDYQAATTLYGRGLALLRSAVRSA